MASSELKVVIIEDEVLIARDLKRICENIGYQVVGLAHNILKAQDVLHNRDYDFVLLDIQLNDHEDGIHLGKIIKAKYDKPFIYITSYGDRKTLFRAKETEPQGYLLKPFDEKDIYTAIEIALVNFEKTRKDVIDYQFIRDKFQIEVTDREMIVLLDVMKGLTNQQIADKNFVSENTIKTHIKNLYTKFNVHSRAELTHRVLN